MNTIKSFTNISDSLEKEIRNLEEICKNFDGLKGTIYLDPSVNINHEINSLFLLYENEKLVSVLSLFIPTYEDAEVSGYTLPQYRKKGYFTRLLAEAVKEVEKYGIQSLLFICEDRSSSGKAVINRLRAQYKFTEYSLVLNKEKLYNISDEDTKMSILEATKEDLNVLVTLNQTVFGDSEQEAISFISKTFETKNRQQYLLKLDQKVIGMATVIYEKEFTAIIGVGISPAYQGRGYGKKMLQILLERLVKENNEKITINVESTNEPAFHLYRKVGFEIETAFSFYRKSISSLI